MSGRGRLPPGSSAPGLGSGAGPPISPGEEANPFSFKEFVRSKNQSTAAATAVGSAKDTSGVALESRGGSSVGPKESTSIPRILDDDDDSLSLESLGLNLGFQEPFFPDPTIVSSMLEDDDDDDWSSSYQPSAIEEVHSARAPSASLSSTFDSFYCNPSDQSDLQAFSPWQLGGSDSLLRSPLGRGDHSLPVDGATVRDGFCPLLQQSYEELKQENSKLRSKINHLQAISETRAQRVKQLERTLEESKQKEAREAQDLEAMVQQVEENLQHMTKRAVKAESGILKLKQENALLQVQVENYRLENEALRSRHLTDLAVVKQNADIALQNLLDVVAKSRSSIKQLISGAEALQLVAELLKSIDKISEVS
ncbi:endosome-associated-trafficking regulator 1 [Tiliqua scincoides]|uniref:endosome-associated-trafficking regulator 1 n=1 Tax=Tiliqua scincoides TaxID=71010 RepID=UPI00346311B1